MPGTMEKDIRVSKTAEEGINEKLLVMDDERGRDIRNFDADAVKR